MLAHEPVQQGLLRLAAPVGPKRIPVEVYADARALSEVSTLPLEAIKTSRTIAVCKFNQILITSPKALVRGYGWQDTLAHEYVHLVVSKKSHNRVPIWFHEGSPSTSSRTGTAPPAGRSRRPSSPRSTRRTS